MALTEATAAPVWRLSSGQGYYCLARMEDYNILSLNLVSLHTRPKDALDRGEGWAH